MDRWLAGRRVAPGAQDRPLGRGGGRRRGARAGRPRRRGPRRGRGPAHRVRGRAAAPVAHGRRGRRDRACPPRTAPTTPCSRSPRSTTCPAGARWRERWPSSTACSGPAESCCSPSTTATTRSSRCATRFPRASARRRGSSLPGRGRARERRARPDGRARRLRGPRRHGGAPLSAGAARSPWPPRAERRGRRGGAPRAAPAGVGEAVGASDPADHGPLRGRPRPAVDRTRLVSSMTLRELMGPDAPDVEISGLAYSSAAVDPAPSSSASAASRPTATTSRPTPWSAARPRSWWSARWAWACPRCRSTTRAPRWAPPPRASTATPPPRCGSWVSPAPTARPPRPSWCARSSSTPVSARGCSAR